MNLDDFDPTTFNLKVVLKGVAGTRKTTQAATFPGPILWFDIDRKAESLFLPRKLNFVPKETKIEIMQYDKWWQIEKHLRELESYCQYKTVVMDTVSSLGDVINRGTLDTEKATGGKKVGGIKVNSIEDFNAETSALMFMVDIGKKINANFVLIAHVINRGERERTLVTGGKVVGAKIPAYFPEVYHFEFDEAFDTSKPPNFVCYTQPHGVDFARTALPLPYKIDLTNARLYDILKKAQLELKTTTPEKLIESKKDGGW